MRRSRDMMKPNLRYALVLRKPEEIAQFMNTRIDSKMAWCRKHLRKYARREWKTWQEKVLEVLYAGNLGLRIPQHGKVLLSEGNTLIVAWQCRCPVLNRCKRQGLPTCHVCSTLYHVQYQALLSLLVPDAFFARDYSNLRPRGKSCIEVMIRRPDVAAFAQKNPLRPAKVRPRAS